MKVLKVEKDLNIQEIMVLESELAGLSYQKEGKEVIFKGLLSQGLLVSAKIHLTHLVDDLSKVKESFSKLRKELLDKHGEIIEAEDGLKRYDLSKNFDEFKKEEEDLLGQTFPIKVPVFEIDDLFPSDLKTDENYPFIYRFLVKSVDEG